MVLLREDLFSLKDQIENWGITPTRFLVHPKTFKDMLQEPLNRLYRMILKEGWKVERQIEHDKGFTFWLKHPTESISEQLVLCYKDDQEKYLAHSFEVK